MGRKKAVAETWAMLEEEKVNFEREKLNFEREKLALERGKAEKEKTLRYIERTSTRLVKELFVSFIPIVLMETSACLSMHKKQMMGYIVQMVKTVMTKHASLVNKSIQQLKFFANSKQIAID